MFIDKVIGNALFSEIGGLWLLLEGTTFLFQTDISGIIVFWMAHLGKLFQN